MARTRQTERPIGQPQGELPPPDAPTQIPVVGVVLLIRCPGKECDRTCTLGDKEPHYCECGIVLYLTSSPEVDVVARRWRQTPQKEGR